ncbi:MAG: penicillin-binding protein 2 [Nitrospirae bacterium]|nr:penicillin-binding protein 2 [Nitrospirota bacterium]
MNLLDKGKESLTKRERFNRIKWRRLNIIFVLMTAGFIAVIIKLAWLQLLQGEALAMKAERQHRRLIDIEGERGNIYDRNRRELAVNLDMSSLYGIPSSIGDPSLVIKKLSYIVDFDTAAIKDKLDSKKHFTWIKRRLSPDIAEKVEALNLKGIGLAPERKRFYPKKQLSGHIIGFTNTDSHGLEGIEKYYEESLNGEKGALVLDRDARGKAVLTSTHMDTLKGNDLVLTIDEVIQYITEKELEAAVEGHNAAGGVGIVMEPYTGAILAMAVSPKFNPNTPDKFGAGGWRNRAITDVYEPGSTFKIVTASAALEEKLYSPNEIVHDGSGSMNIGTAVIHDPHPKGKPMTFREVISHSSNIGSAKIGIKLGDKRLHEYIRAFGFGDKSGIDLPGEVRGIVRPPETWSGRSLATIAIGQEVGITPIQLASAMSAIANGGLLVRPHIVSDIIDLKGNENKIHPEIVRRVISENTSKKMTEILKWVVSNEGTGKLAAVDGFSVAGKTGTAQKVDPATGRYSSNKFISSFIGFVPADSPELVILIVVDEPKGVSWGGSVAAPVFHSVAQQTLRYMHVEPVEQQKITIMANNTPD